MPLSQFDERVPNGSLNTYANPTAAGPLQLIVGRFYGTRLDQMILTWNGVAPFEVDIQLNDGFGDIAALGTVTIPAAVGTVLGTASVFDLLMPSSQAFVILANGTSIYVVTKAAISGSDVLTAWTSGGDF